MISDDLQHILNTSHLIQQGAEAQLYKIVWTHSEQDDEFALLKFRFPKTYRHPILDAQLTKTRLTFEARCLVRALKMGIRVPLLKGVDLNQGCLILEWINGITLRQWLQENQQQQQKSNNQTNSQLVEILKDVGIQIAKLHSADIIHGDLTTSNMMLRPIQFNSTTNYQVVLIDFGLSSVTNLLEDKAVDLYVLERAFISTHSDHLHLHSSPLFKIILESYANTLPKSNWNSLKTRLENVRSRGRKRSMLG